MRGTSPTAVALGIVAATCLFDLSLAAQPPLDLATVQPIDRITTPANDAARVTLTGNRHPLARPEYDDGPVAPDSRLERMMLVLRPDATQQQALEHLLAEQQDPLSPLYHQWLTPETFGQAFGVSDHDLTSVVAWLEGSGFRVEPIGASRRVVIFSGTAAQVNAAFHAELRRYRMNGAPHQANASDPQIPRALAPVVGGVVSLHDFHTKPQHALAMPAAQAAPEYSEGGIHLLAPADFATIYDLAPLYGSSTDGTSQSIAVVGRTNIYLSDIASFRSEMGLPANPPTIILNGPDPGIVSQEEQMEGELDVEWSGAVAKKAAIQFVVSASTQTTDGVDLSAQYIVDHNLAPVVSLSFGECESAMGTAENQFWNALWQQAAAQGMSVFVASGDNGAAGCDADSAAVATNGLAVNGLCSPSYSTCVGGTEFSGDTTDPALYWSPNNNASTLGSAQSYIPEAAWNQSGIVTGGSGLWSSGGGASSLYSKPSWQSGTGVPADGRRDVPDVALTAAGHDAYLVCLNGQYYGVMGTSAATPSFAGVMAMVVERQNARQGNANPVLYGLRSRQAAGLSAVFHEMTGGNNSVPGQAGYSAGAGYNLVTGLGSVDANNLVNAWSGGSTPSFQLAPSAAATSVAQGKSTTVALTVNVSGGFQSTVALAAGGVPAGLTATFAPANLTPASYAPSGSATSTFTLTASPTLAAGIHNLVLQASGGGITRTVPLAVTVVPNCVYTLTPASASEVAAAGTYTVSVTAGTGCAWSATSTVNWMSITGAATGSGNGTVKFSVIANTAATPRSGSLTIAGLVFSVTQAGAPSTAFSLAATSVSATAAGGNGSVAVSAPSATATWKAVSNASWIVITAASSFTGSQRVTYNVAANASTAARTGTMIIAGLTYTVNQAGASCTYTLTLGSVSATATGYLDSVSITAPAGCAWMAVSNVSWIKIQSGTSGSGGGTVFFTIARNTTGKTETGTLTVAGHVVTITLGVTGSARIGAPVRLP